MDKPLVTQVPAHANNYLKTSYPKTGIVLHWIVGSLASADKTFQDSTRIASTHYGIGKDGAIHQYVADNYTAYHAGVGTYNRSHFGIEHEGGHLYNGERVKPSPECHQASIRMVAWLCETYKIPCDRQHIIKHSETGYATQCCGTLDIDYIVSEASKLLNQPPMAFNYELYLKGTELFMKVTSGSINQNVTVKNVTKNTSWQVFCNKKVGSDGGPINVDMQKDLYEVNALGVVKQYDNRPAPVDPCAGVKGELALVKEQLSNANKAIITKDGQINDLNGALGGMTADRNKYAKLAEEANAKLGVETLEKNRLKIELEGMEKQLGAVTLAKDTCENELRNVQPKIDELEKEVVVSKGIITTQETELETANTLYKRCLDNSKGTTLAELLQKLWHEIRNIFNKRFKKT